MTKIRSLLRVLLAIVFVSGCASTATAAASQGLVGAWLVSASRAGGQGVVLLTFITQGPTDSEFSGLAKVRVLDTGGKEERTSETNLTGRRIVVEPF